MNVEAVPSHARYIIIVYDWLLPLWIRLRKGLCSQGIVIHPYLVDLLALPLIPSPSRRFGTPNEWDWKGVCTSRSWPLSLHCACPSSPQCCWDQSSARWEPFLVRSHGICAGGDLHAAIRKDDMNLAGVGSCFKQLLTGLGYLHGQGVTHQNIKPENLFCDFQGWLKVRASGQCYIPLVPPNGWPIMVQIFFIEWQFWCLDGLLSPLRVSIHKSPRLCGSKQYIMPEQFAHSCGYLL